MGIRVARSRRVGELSPEQVVLDLRRQSVAHTAQLLDLSGDCLMRSVRTRAPFHRRPHRASRRTDDWRRMNLTARESDRTPDRVILSCGAISSRDARDVDRSEIAPMPEQIVTPTPGQGA